MNGIELSKEAQARAIASIERYAEENFFEPLSGLQARALLNYMVAEIGPEIYNQAIRDAQLRLGQRVMDLDGELFAETFPYWPQEERRRRAR